MRCPREGALMTWLTVTSLSVETSAWPLRQAFTISRGTRTEIHVVTAEIRDGDHVGRGECTPYPRYGESVEGVMAEIEAMAPALAGGLDRAALQMEMKPGAARNALDCAFWDLEAKRAGRPAWALAGLPEPCPVITAYTLSLGPPDKMRVAAAENSHRPLLKIKLGGEDDIVRLRAVREGAPNARLILDANEGWTLDAYAAIAPELNALGVEMVEQPLPAADDSALEGAARPVALCADESCHDRATLDALVGRYDMINIKLDKTGGLTEALALKADAEAKGLKIMVGCMMATSLAMAPAMLVAQGAAVVDLDPPLLLAKDREPALHYDTAGAHPAPTDLWG
jgi:L-alanine-DL-glutamate epimerase-like enolase superfamily enzyme